MKRTSIILFFPVIIFLSFLSLDVYGQPPLEYDDVLDNEVPFDGGVLLLLAGAIGYGVKKLPGRKRGVDTNARLGQKEAETVKRSKSS